LSYLTFKALLEIWNWQRGCSYRPDTRPVCGARGKSDASFTGGSAAIAALTKIAPGNFVEPAFSMSGFNSPDRIFFQYLKKPRIDIISELWYNMISELSYIIKSERP
jgi:hypothetical protein